jgi:hypothetical protein
MLNIIEKKRMKAKILLYLCFLPSVCAYSQKETDSDCNSNIINVFKVYDHKIKYETVQHIYEKHNFLYAMSKDMWNNYFKLIRGYPLYEEQQDSVSEVKHKKLLESMKLQDYRKKG